MWRFPEMGLPPSHLPFLWNFPRNKPTLKWGIPMAMERLKDARDHSKSICDAPSWCWMAQESADPSDGLPDGVPGERHEDAPIWPLDQRGNGDFPSMGVPQ